MTQTADVPVEGGHVEQQHHHGDDEQQQASGNTHGLGRGAGVRGAPKHSRNWQTRSKSQRDQPKLSFYGFQCTQVLWGNETTSLVKSAKEDLGRAVSPEFRS